jgi:hypothetical protein
MDHRPVPRSLREFIAARWAEHVARPRAAAREGPKPPAPPRLPPPAPWSRQHHPATGSDYVVLGIGVDSTNGPHHGTPMVAYISLTTGQLRFRDLAQFADGRFVPAPDHPGFPPNPGDVGSAPVPVPVPAPESPGP